MVKKNKELGASPLSASTACSPSGSSPVPGLAADALRPTGAFAEFKRKADNLRCAANAVRGDADEREFFAPKIGATCERTADWLEEMGPTLTDLYEALKALADAVDEHVMVATAGALDPVTEEARAALRQAEGR